MTGIAGERIIGFGFNRRHPARAIAMPSITTELAGILSKVHRHGNFFTFGKTEILAPRLEVTGVGLVALPLLPAQAEQLIAVADQAPHRRGAELWREVGDGVNR